MRVTRPAGRLQTIVVVVVAAVCVVGTPAAWADTTPISGAGSSFVKLEMDQWRAELARPPYSFKINYSATGSGVGRQQYAAGNIDFAVSDIPFPQAELALPWPRGPHDYVYVPVSASGLGFMYHLTDTSGQLVTSLKLTRAAVCLIFTTPGGLFWDDPMFTSVNPGLTLFHEPVVPFVRSGEAGTSYSLSAFCRATEPNIWQTFRTYLNSIGQLATDPELNADRPTATWPLINGMQWATSADGVAAAVADPASGEGRVTYNEASFAAVRGFPNASVQNAAGQFTQPTADAVTTALGHVHGNADGTFVADSAAPDPSAYLPAISSYVIAPTAGLPLDKGDVLARFICYGVTTGQRRDLTVALGYASLSPALVDIAMSSVAEIPGAPPWDQCVASPTPPVDVPEFPGGPIGIALSAGWAMMMIVRRTRRRAGNAARSFTKSWPRVHSVD